MGPMHQKALALAEISLALGLKSDHPVRVSGWLASRENSDLFDFESRFRSLAC
jgi:hypothetical protein